MPTKKAEAASRVMDVTHPNKVKPTASGVPIIITNRPIMKDPMVVQSETKAETTEKDPAQKTPAATKIELKPLDQQAPAAEASEVATNEAQEAPLLPIAELEKIATKKTSTDEKVETTAESEVASDAGKEVEPALPPSSEAATPAAADEPTTDTAVETVAEPQKASKATEPLNDPANETQSNDFLSAQQPADEKAVKEARAAAEKQLALEKLISEGTYVLPVNAVEKRRMHELALVVVLIVLVLGIAGFLLALDAGLLHVPGLTAPTDFIKG